ncbi:hypothetical protein B0H13DRAFT_2569597 [Mycena leptocephala]|nr:hypothetical protein B0H13DRAFT_2569597 [Mycena leptocephala]
MADQTQSQLPPHSPFTLDNTLGAAYRILVVVLLVLEATDQAFIGYFLYFYTVTSAGNPLAIATGTNTWSIIVRNLVLVAYLVLNYFFLSVAASHRLRRGHHSEMVLLALGQLGVAMGLLTDVVTAGALCFFLWRMRTAQKNSAANSIINRLVGDAINTGVLTTAVSLSTLLLFDFLEGNLFFGATYFMLSKLYAVSLLATLNTRRVVRARGTDRDQATTSGRRTTRTLGRSVPPEVETNMFHLGTRMPSMHEPEAAYLDFDTANYEPGYPPEPLDLRNKRKRAIPSIYPVVVPPRVVLVISRVCTHY